MIGFIDILLVEDNAYEAELAIRAFKKRTMANCIVLLDLNLPKIGGLEVLLKIRSNENTRMVPVVVLTASSEERDMVASYRLGANSYVVKPHDFEKFLEVTSNLITYWLLINQLPQLKPRK